MLELLVVGQPVVCTTGTCPNVASVVAVAPAVVSAPPVAMSLSKTTVTYRRGLLGQLRPVSGLVTYEPIAVEAKGKGKPAKAAAQSCKSCGK